MKKFILLVAAALLCFNPSLLAQTFGEITGQVADSTGAVVAAHR